MPFASTANVGGLRRKVSLRVESSTMSSGDFLEGGQQQGDTAPLLDGHHASIRLQESSESTQRRRSSGSSNSVIVSPSVRALAALNGSPVPLSPERVEAEAARRTSSIPRSRVRSPSDGHGSQKRFTYPSSTAKTADLIGAFPKPPHAQVRTRNSAPARMNLFQSVAGLEGRRSDNSQLSPSGRQRNTTNSASEQSTLPGFDSTRTPSASNAWLSGALPNPPECDGSPDTTAINSRPVRGEDLRYRHSGTLVYDDDATSLREVDQEDDRDVAALLDHPGSPVSCKTGATRYFSAASQLGMNPKRSVASTPAPVVSNVDGQSRGENRVQQEKVVANDALRFVSQRLGRTGSTLAVREEVDAPVAMTSHGKACLHRKKSLRAQSLEQSGVDGAQWSEEKQSR